MSSKLTLDAYLFFDGNCKEAMNFYKSIFGGELTLSTYGDMPGTDPKNKDKIIHADLKGGEIDLMASDSGTGAVAGVSKIQLSLGGTDEQWLTKIFNDLAAGGLVKDPLSKKPWGDIFGMLKDKYGIEWMMNIGSDK